MIKIRRAELKDAPAILNIFVSSIRELAKGYYSDDQIAVWAGRLTLEKIHQAITVDETCIAEINGTPAGYGQLDISTGIIEAVFVLPEFKRQGVGSAILKHIEEVARANGINTLRLRSSLNAFEFYKHLGYEETERIVHCADGIEFDCINMKKDIRHE
ncbi:MAG TPA: GNAT family N-acetyltransferase [Armatimonadota bacterium]|nr:GNAT family N-acetyltransferase [Armatimonadota bacterium]HPP75664.1 GNAT family N-acetyltransferase [Armatimonadota bacterium]